MSTESRIDRDAKAAGGVVAEGREHDAAAEASEELDIMMDALACGQIVMPHSASRHMKALLRVILDALAAAQAREAVLREAASNAAKLLLDQFCIAEASASDITRWDDDDAFDAFWQLNAALATPTPEAPDHD